MRKQFCLASQFSPILPNSQLGLVNNDQLRSGAFIRWGMDLNNGQGLGGLDVANTA